MRPIKQKPIKFNNVCGCVVDYLELEKAICWWSDKPVCSIKKIFMYGRYPAVAIYKEKLHVHRLLFSYWLQEMLERKICVHHKDKNPLNALKNNLALMDASTHQSITHKGKKQTFEHMAKRINATSLTRYGHIIYEHPELLPGKE